MARRIRAGVQKRATLRAAAPEAEARRRPLAEAPSPEADPVSTARPASRQSSAAAAGTTVDRPGGFPRALTAQTLRCGAIDRAIKIALLLALLCAALPASASARLDTGFFDTPVSYTHLTLPTNREV